MKTGNFLYQRIEKFFFQPRGTAEFLVFFRIGAGVVILFHFLSTIYDFDTLYSSHGIVPQDIMNVFTPDLIITLPTIVAYLRGMGIDESITLQVYQYTFIGLCICLIVGWYSRISAFLLLFLQVALTKGNSFFIYGVDFFNGMSLFYLVLFPADQYFSLRARWLKVKHYENYMPVKRMFQIHISLAYFFSGLDKALGFNWRNGESIWKAIHLPYANQDFFFDFSWMAHHTFILVIAGWMTFIIEGCYPLFIWIAKTRRTWLLLTLSLHIGIAIVLNLYYFSAIMIVWNLAAFYFSEKEVPKQAFVHVPEPLHKTPVPFQSRGD